MYGLEFFIIGRLLKERKVSIKRKKCYNLDVL